MRLTEFYKSALSNKPKARTQDNVWSCAPAAVKAVLEHFGYYVPEQRLSKMMSTFPNIGTFHSVFKQVLQQYGLDTREYNKANYSQLVEASSSDCPIITDFHNQYGNHYVTVMQANDRGVEFLDTAQDQGIIRKLPKDDFVKQWYNTFTPPQTISRGWMIVVSDGQSKLATSGKAIKPLDVIPSAALQMADANKGLPADPKKPKSTDGLLQVVPRSKLNTGIL